MPSSRLAGMITLVITIIALTSAPLYARGGMGGFHGQGFHIGGVGVPYGGVSLGSAAAGSHTGYGYSKVHFHPLVGYYHQASHPFSYSPGGTGGFHYNQSFANPSVYHNPYMYHPSSNPYAVPFTHPF